MDSIKSVKHQISDVMKNNRTDMKKIKEKAQGQIAGIRINSIADMKRIREEANEEVRTQRLVARSCMNKNVTLQGQNDTLIHQLDNTKQLKALALSRARTSEMMAAYLQKKNLKLISEIKCSDKEVQEQVKLGLGQVFATNEENNSLSSWPHWMLQLILEILVNGTPPSSVPMNIRSQANITMPHIIIERLPTARFVCSC